MDLRDIITKDVTVGSLKKSRTHRERLRDELEQKLRELVPKKMMSLSVKWLERFWNKPTSRWNSDERWAAWQFIDASIDEKGHDLIGYPHTHPSRKRVRIERKTREKLDAVAREMKRWTLKDATYLADNEHDAGDVAYEAIENKFGIDMGELPNAHLDYIMDKGGAHFWEKVYRKTEEHDGWFDPRRHGTSSGLIKKLKLRRKYELKFYGKTNLPVNISSRNVNAAMRTSRPNISCRVKALYLGS